VLEQRACVEVGAQASACGEQLRELSFSVPERAAFGIQTIVSWSLAIAACVGISSPFALGHKH
jgi:hypothetical protein